MLRNLIHNWLISGADVEVGLRLFIEYANPNHKALRIISKNPQRHAQTIRTALFKAAGLPFDFLESIHARIIEAPLNSSKEGKFKVRNQWPFLSNPDCPPELKLLVSDKITVFSNCVRLYSNLTNVSNNDEQLQTVAKLVGNFIENHNIYKELNHYLEHGKILGKHEIFSQYMRIKALRNLNTMDLFNKKKNLENNIWRTKSKIKKEKRLDLLPGRETKLKELNMQLAEVNRLLQ